jgi:uncharacterized protein YdhG (YjbR/CyaY superfamily)
MLSKPEIKDVESYIAGFSPAMQKLLNQLRNTIRKAAPKGEEYIGYQMPAYKFHGPLVYFAGYEKHIGFYPGASGIENFKKEISIYKNAKGSVQFPLDRPLPLDLVKQIVQFRITENLDKEELKKLKKKKK